MEPWSETTDPLSLLDRVGRVVSPPLWHLIPLFGGPFPSPIRGALVAVCLWGQELSVVEQGGEWQDQVVWG